MRYEDVYKMKKHSLEECLALIESGDTIAVSGVATEPTEFLSHFTEIVPRPVSYTHLQLSREQKAN